MATQTGSTLSPTVWQLSLQFRRQIWGFWPRPYRRNWPRAIATTTDNRKLQYGRFACQSRNFWQSVVVAIIWLILCRARRHRKTGISRWNLDAICPSSRDVIISGFGAISTFPVVGHCCTYLPTLFYTYTWSYTIPQICRWNFNCTFHSLRDISISGFGRHFRLSLIIGIA